MPSLFQGAPQEAKSYTTSTSETPKWMQDAIYNQIQWATNTANQAMPQYDMPRVAELSPLQQQAYQSVVANQGAWSPTMQQAQSGMFGFTDKGTAEELGAAQAPYMQPGLAGQNLAAGQQLFGRAGQQDITGAAQPYLTQAGQTTAQSMAERALSAANPYLQASAQTAASQVGQYMSPYQQNVLDVIAKQAGRNLRENIMPNIGEAFIKAGQFGSSRMGEMGARAARDTQEAVLNAQAQAAQQGYGQAMQAAQSDLARQAQLAGTVGSISGADLSRMLQGGSQYGTLAQTAGQLTGQQMQNLAALAQARTQAGQAQQQLGLGAAQAVQGAQAADYQRQMAALNQLAQMGQQEQAMRAADVAALETAGTAQQTQMQRQLDAAYQQFMEQQLYPKQQLDWLSTQIRGMAPITPQTVTQQGQTTGATYSPSPLSQLASGVFAFRGLSGLGS
jgi:hypothetical protein